MQQRHCLGSKDHNPIMTIHQIVHQPLFNRGKPLTTTLIHKGVKEDAVLYRRLARQSESLSSACSIPTEAVVLCSVHDPTTTANPTHPGA